MYEIIEDEFALKFKEELKNSINNYKKIMRCLEGDAPIEILGLPKKVEKVLFARGIFRIYDLFDLDFTKIEGLNDVAVRDLTSRFNQFVSMC